MIVTAWALAFAPARADDDGHGHRGRHKRADAAPCCEQEVPCTVDKVHLQLTVVPEKYTVCVPGATKEVVKAISRPVEQDVVRCRTVPVCVIDPCTGCPRTEYKQESYVERVKATVIDFVSDTVVTPPKTEERVRNTFRVSIEHCPVPVIHEAACPAPACPACGH
jgi:hypothetical protein